MQTAKGSLPTPSELFYASLIATGLVYCAGALLFTVVSYFGAQTGGLVTMMQALMMFASIGLIAATGLAFLVVAPMGTALGLAMLRVTPAGWWQGPLTGMLVALSLEALVVLPFSAGRMEWEWGNAVTLSIPVVLAMIAGAIVQRKVLRWPARG